MKVTNMTSAKGTKVADQFIIDHQNISVFQSYESIIVKISTPCDQSLPLLVELDERYYNYSKTTSRYRNQFLGETTKETQDKINSGEYVLTNLN